ncbi:MAG: hypothetical protein ACYC8T_10685 [Myxococcaceae bacterium]
MTLYLPDELEKELRRGAKRAKKSLSAYVAELAAQRLQPQGWPKGFLETFGGWKGSFPEPSELPYEERDPL